MEMENRYGYVRKKEGPSWRGIWEFYLLYPHVPVLLPLVPLPSRVIVLVLSCLAWFGLVWSGLVLSPSQPNLLGCLAVRLVSVRISFVISCVLVWTVLGLVGGVVVSCTCVCPALPCPGLPWPGFLALALLASYSPPAPTLPSSLP